MFQSFLVILPKVPAHTTFIELYGLFWYISLQTNNNAFNYVHKTFSLYNYYYIRFSSKIYSSEDTYPVIFHSERISIIYTNNFKILSKISVTIWISYNSLPLSLFLSLSFFLSFCLSLCSFLSDKFLCCFLFIILRNILNCTWLQFSGYQSRQIWNLRFTHCFEDIWLVYFCRNNIRFNVFLLQSFCYKWVVVIIMEK